MSVLVHPLVIGELQETIPDSDAETQGLGERCELGFRRDVRDQMLSKASQGHQQPVFPEGLNACEELNMFLWLCVQCQNSPTQLLIELAPAQLPTFCKRNSFVPTQLLLIA